MIYLLCFFSSAFFLKLGESYGKQKKNMPSMIVQKIGSGVTSFHLKRNIPQNSWNLSKSLAAFFVLVGLFIPSILAGLRDFSIGTDVKVYGNAWFYLATWVEPWWEYLKWAGVSDIGVLYALLNYVVAKFTNDPHVFYFVLTFVNISALYLTFLQFRDSISVPFAMLVYYLLFYNASLNMLRQSLAMSLMFVAYACIAKDQTKRFLIMWFLSCLAHSSAILMIVLLPLKWYSERPGKQLRSLLIFCVIAIIMCVYSKILSFMIYTGLLSERYLKYTIAAPGGGRVSRTILFLFIVVLIVIGYSALIKAEKSGAFFINSALIAAALTLLLFFGNNEVIRIAYYFDLSLLFIFPMLNNAIKFELFDKKIKVISLILLVLLIGYWVFTIVIQGNGETYPYQLYF